MTRAYTTDQVLSRLSEYVTAHGRATTCQRGGFNASYLSQVLTGKTPPSAKVLALLDMEWAIIARRPG